MHKSAHGWSKLAGTAVLLGLAIALAVACGSSDPAPTATARPAAQVGIVITLGDIDEMARWMRDGTVDVYFDSAFPSLAVQQQSGSEIILRRWKEGVVEYWSTYLALRSTNVETVEDLVGTVVAFEEPRSTSGFVLPAGTLIQQGFALREVESPDAAVASDEIGYLFSRDEENTIALVLDGKVAAGGVSIDDFEELPAELKEKLKSFGRTITVPRQLVSVRPGLDRALADRVRALLIGLEQSDEGLQILNRLKKTARFDPLPADAGESLQELERLIKLVGDD